MTREYRIISGDTHLEVPAWRWTNRVPERYRDRAPRTVRLANGGDALLVEGQPLRENANDMYGGKRDTWRPTGNNYDNTPGTGSPEERLRCLDIDGMDAEVMFHSVVHGPRTWRSIRDDDVYKACIRAYNDFMAEEYAAFAPERFFPMGVIPQTNLRDALEEMAHCQQMGLKGVSLQAFPSGKEYPTPEDDAFWAEALRTQMPVTVHVELVRTSGNRDGSLVKFPKAFGGQDLADRLVKFARTGGFNVVQLILGGVFDRFPDLRILFAENQLCWVPVFMTVMEERYEKHLGWAQELLGFEPLRCGKPSDYVRRHVLWGFQHDPAGVQLRDWYGEDNAIWGSDFPHQESEYPHSLDVIESNFRGVPDEVRYKMTCGNALKFFHLSPVMSAAAEPAPAGD
jgi:predicted TIM-barrel fold metal-dependent hydrolase